MLKLNTTNTEYCTHTNTKCGYKIMIPDTTNAKYYTNINYLYKY